MTRKIEVNDVVQLDPLKARNRAFSGCFLTVTEVHESWVEGYVQVLGTSFREAGGTAHYRAHLDEFEGPIGRAVWCLR